MKSDRVPVLENAKIRIQFYVWLVRKRILYISGESLFRFQISKSLRGVLRAGLFFRIQPSKCQVGISYHHHLTALLGVGLTVERDAATANPWGTLCPLPLRGYTLKNLLFSYVFLALSRKDMESIPRLLVRMARGLRNSTPAVNN